MDLQVSCNCTQFLSNHESLDTHWILVQLECQQKDCGVSMKVISITDRSIR